MDSSVRRVLSTALVQAGSTAIPSIGESLSIPIRSLLGGASVMHPTKDVSGVGGDHHAPGSWRARTSRAAAVSATDRVRTPLVASPSTSTVPLVIKPRVAFRPTSPVQDAGTRIEAPPSAACAIGAIPAATATPAPLDDPPGVRSGSQGLREIPRASLSVKGTAPNSEVVVFPNRRKPASTNRCTTGSDCVAGALLAPADP